ncbi:MAG: hypothetical protein AB7G75_05830 [Candidatus Binatia bacterium]
MKTLLKSVMALVFSAGVFPTLAHADTIRFCVHINAEYSDSCRGFGPQRATDPGVCNSAEYHTEDYWADRYFVKDSGTGDYPHPLTNAADKARHQAFRGGHIKIVEGSTESGKELFNGYLDDGSNNAVGCTGWLTPNTAAGDYWIRIWSEGKVRGFRYKAVGNDGNVRYMDYVRNFPASASGTTQRLYLFTGRYPGDSSATDAQRLKRRIFQAGNALAFSLARERLGVAPIRITLRVRPGGGTAHGCDDGLWVWWFDGLDATGPQDECIGVPGSGEYSTNPSIELDSKTIVSHELGHVLLKRRLGGVPTINYSYDGPAGPRCIASATGHRLSSIEFNSAALWEGFAHAYATKVWNDPSEPDAVFPAYSGGIVDMDSGRGSYPERKMETDCTDAGTSPGGFSGKGNETDWARAFWELHTCDPTGDTSLSRIAGVLDSAANWSSTNAYANVNTAMNATATPAQMRTCWNRVKAENGIDH